MGFDPNLPYKNVDGENINLTADEIAEREQAASLWAAGQAKRDALEQIGVLEGKVTQRRLRDALLGTDGGWLAEINNEIAALRGQLK